MVKESARKCSHCGNNGHNSRTCNGKGSVKLFGVFILTNKKQELIRKSKSMGDLIACNGEHSNLDEGYLSDGLIDSRRDKEAHERKKGIPWTEDEHRFFLAGLDKLGKGDWRGISKTFVPSRTPTQVASHAQKYFIRLGSSDKKKRRSSLFDLSFKEPEIHRSPLQAPLEKNGEISQQANNPPAAVNLNNFCHTQGQASTSVASPLDAPPVFPLASTCGVPDLYMPMMGFAGNGQATSGAKGIPTISFVPVMNFLNRGYFYMPKGYGNSATCAPFLSHP